MTLNPMMIMQMIGFAAEVGQELTEDPDLKERFGALKWGIDTGAQLGSMVGSFKSPINKKNPIPLPDNDLGLTNVFKPRYSSGGHANLLKIGPSTQPNLDYFKPSIEPMYGIGAGWGI